MDAARQFPAPHAAQHSSDIPILPQAPARPAPTFERRDVDITLVARHEPRRSPMRSYVFIAIGLAAFSAATWIGLAEYIYG